MSNLLLKTHATRAQPEIAWQMAHLKSLKW